jgi:sec-independent protein translocase protein TatA
MSLGPAEILVVLVLALVVFGPKRLPEVGRQVGGALRELRKVQDTVQTEIRSVMDETVGPIRDMGAHLPSAHVPAADAPAPVYPGDPVPRELPAGEPDLGDEHNQPPAPSASEPDRDPEGPGIDGLSGGTFS